MDEAGGGVSSIIDPTVRDSEEDREEAEEDEDGDTTEMVDFFLRGFSTGVAMTSTAVAAVAAALDEGLRALVCLTGVERVVGAMVVCD